MKTYRFEYLYETTKGTQKHVGFIESWSIYHAIKKLESNYCGAPFVPYLFDRGLAYKIKT